MRQPALTKHETFKRIWEQLKVSLNLTDEDLTMGYKIKVTNGIAILGWLCSGKAKAHPRYYPHPSNAQRAISRYLAKNGDHKCEIIPWNGYTDTLPVIRITRKKENIGS